MTAREKIIKWVRRASSAIHDSTQWEDPYYAIEGLTIMEELVQGILADLGIEGETAPVADA